MKICIIPTMFPKYKGDYYGSFVFDEAKMLVKKGFEVHVVTQHNSGIPYEELMEGIHVHRFKWLEPNEFKALVHFKGLIDNFRLLTYVISIFFNLIILSRKYDFDILHAHSAIPTGLIGVIVTKILKKPIFITVHGMDINNFENSSIFKRLITFSLNNCTKAIAVSDNLAKKMRYLKINQNKIVILRNAVDTNRFKPLRNENLRKYCKIKDNEILILFVGYLDTFKGIFDIIDAFGEIKQTHDNIKLMIIGNGPKKHELENRVLALDLKNSVIFTGKLKPDEIHSYYQAADIFTLPSYTEGLPLAVLEAMSCGIPVIASNVGGIPEIIKNNENGFLIPPKNKKILKNNLIILIDNARLREKFRRNSIEIIKDKFDINKKINILIKLYSNE